MAIKIGLLEMVHARWEYAHYENSIANTYVPPCPVVAIRSHEDNFVAFCHHQSLAPTLLSDKKTGFPSDAFIANLQLYISHGK